jgi:hypothetical protein
LTGKHDIAVAKCRVCHHREIKCGFQIRNRCDERVIKVEEGSEPGLYCAPAALRPCRFATPSPARRWLRSTPSNGWTAC